MIYGPWPAPKYPVGTGDAEMYEVRIERLSRLASDIDRMLARDVFEPATVKDLTGRAERMREEADDLRTVLERWREEPYVRAERLYGPAVKR